VRKLKKLLFVILVLVVLAVVVVFMLENQQPTALVVLGFTGPQLPVSVFVLAAFLCGLVIGPLLALLASLRRPRMRKAGSI